MGVHFTMMLPLDLFSGGTPAPEDYDADEASMATGLQNFFATESAYSVLQNTRPQTIAVALAHALVGGRGRPRDPKRRDSPARAPLLPFLLVPLADPSHRLNSSSAREIHRQRIRRDIETPLTPARGSS
jgi:hypothetical protein